MTVAYEQYSKFCKHGSQKNACPSFREIGSTEIRIRKDESSRFIVDCTVQINDPVEIVPDREGWSAVLRYIPSELQRGSRKMTIEVCRDYPRAIGFTRHAQQVLV